MKKNILLMTLMTLAGLLMAGCQQKGDHHRHPSQESTVKSQSKESGLRLNNGQKWQANLETTDGIRKMQGSMERFREQESMDYAELHKELDTHLQEIIQQCTMKGEAHQQLHYYLEPLMGHMRQLKEEQAPESRQEAARAINRQLNSYTEFFE